MLVDPDPPIRFVAELLTRDFVATNQTGTPVKKVLGVMLALFKENCVAVLYRCQF